MTDNAMSADETARANKIASLTSLANEFETSRRTLEVSIAGSLSHLSGPVVGALHSVVLALGSAQDMLQGQIALIPPAPEAPPAPAGEGDA